MTWPPGPTPTPRPIGTLFPAPRDGQLVKTGANYLEFVSNVQQNRTVFFAFPYDSKAQGVVAADNQGNATLALDGGTAAPMIARQFEGAILFYFFPTLSAGTHQVKITATIKGVTYSGTFVYP